MGRVQSGSGEELIHFALFDRDLLVNPYFFAEIDISKELKGLSCESKFRGSVYWRDGVPVWRVVCLSDHSLYSSELSLLSAYSWNFDLQLSG
jgi:hypothetical protein